jgi:TolB-like protein/Tfp pilus assembly protein PilF
VKGVSVSVNEASIAVLPFVDLSHDPENAYFADGITDDIITALSRIRGLKVISRTSSARYRGGLKNLREIGAELEVGTILEGSVRRQGDRVRIVAQLIEARSDAHLWAETFDRKLEDIFAIQSEVAGHLAGVLEMSMSPTERARIAGRRTENAEAYDVYLMGRCWWNERTPESLQRAIESFERAIELDPGFSLAHAGLAQVYAVISAYTPVPVREAQERAAACGERALELDPSLGEVHAVLGHVAVADWRWGDAEGHYRRAIELNPSNATAHHWYGEYHVWRGRFENAVEQLRRAQQLDPHSLLIKTAAARPYLAAGRFDEAVRQLLRVLGIAPDYGYAYGLLAVAYHAMGRYDESLTALERARGIPWLDGTTVAAFRAAFHEEGLEGYLRAAARTAEAKCAPPITIAAFHAGLGDRDRAFQVLELACAVRDPTLRVLLADPLIASLRDDARFGRLLERVGLDR